MNISSETLQAGKIPSAKKHKVLSKKGSQSRFLFFFLLYPVIQFLIFYIGVNFNSILLAFKDYNTVTATYSFAGFVNFGEIIQDLFVNGNLTLALQNSLIQFVVTFFIGIPVSVIVSYGVYKKIPFAGFFKVMLFMPNMINGMVFVICGENIINYGFPIIFGEGASELLYVLNPSSFYTVLVFGFWMQFAGSLVVYLGAMSSIPQEVMEYGKLERLSSMRELFSIVVPLIFPTITTYVVVGIAGFFTNYGFFYSFFQGSSGAFDTLGYVFFVKVADATSMDTYPYAAAGGLLFTFVLTPITLSVKALLEKFGPSEE